MFLPFVPVPLIDFHPSQPSHLYQPIDPIFAPLLTRPCLLKFDLEKLDMLFCHPRSFFLPVYRSFALFLFLDGRFVGPVVVGGISFCLVVGGL